MYKIKSYHRRKNYNPLEIEYLFTVFNGMRLDVIKVVEVTDRHFIKTYMDEDGTYHTDPISIEPRLSNNELENLVIVSNATGVEFNYIYEAAWNHTSDIVKIAPNYRLEGVVAKEERCSLIDTFEYETSGTNPYHFDNTLGFIRTEDDKRGVITNFFHITEEDEGVGHKIYIPSTVILNVYTMNRFLNGKVSISFRNSIDECMRMEEG